MAIKRPSDLIPAPLLVELTRLSKLEGPLLDLEILEPGHPLYGVAVLEGTPAHFRCHIKHQSPLLRTFCRTGADWCGQLALCEWLRQGPKVCIPTAEQEESLVQVAIELDLSDYSQPFPAMLVELNHNKIFSSCLLYRYSPEVLILQLNSHDHTDDICTMVRTGQPVERSLEKIYEHDHMDAVLPYSLIAQRVALNMCLALTNWGFSTSLALPKEAEAEAKLRKEKSERGDRARERARIAVSNVSFNREVIICRSPPHGEAGEPSGRERYFGWVRGHWKMQPHGPAHSLRKRILVAPYMVRADLLVGDAADVVTTYKDRR